MSQQFIAQQHSLLDEIALSVHANDYATALQHVNSLAANCQECELKFVPQTGYTQLLFADWMDTLYESITAEDSTQALEAQSAVYEMLDSLSNLCYYTHT